MTATDSSQLEPDLHHSETEPTPHASGTDQDAQSSVESVESPKPATILPPAAASGSDFREATPDERPRAARVAEGAWLGGVCTGLARHLGPWGPFVVALTACGLCWLILFDLFRRRVFLRI